MVYILIKKGNLKKIAWGRGARTDKGVHAICNTINLKLAINRNHLIFPDSPEEEKNNIQANEKEEIEEKSENKTEEQKEEEEFRYTKKDNKDKVDFSRLISLMNSKMENIQVICIKRVTHRFGVKNSATHRVYEYIAPLFLFQAKDSILTEEQTMERINAMCGKFKGTHNFHNYSQKIEPTDPSAKRYILDMKAEKFPFESEIPFIKFTIKGQSFIYHQIRKMIGSISQTIQTGLENSYIENTFYNNKVKIWLAPSEGLMLREIGFNNYNKKTDCPESLEFSEEEKVRMQKFTETKIFPSILNSEQNEKL